MCPNTFVHIESFFEILWDKTTAHVLYLGKLSLRTRANFAKQSSLHVKYHDKLLNKDLPWQFMGIQSMNKFKLAKSQLTVLDSCWGILMLHGVLIFTLLLIPILEDNTELHLCFLIFTLFLIFQLTKWAERTLKQAYYYLGCDHEECEEADEHAFRHREQVSLLKGEQNSSIQTGLGRAEKYRITF